MSLHLPEYISPCMIVKHWCKVEAVQKAIALWFWGIYTQKNWCLYVYVDILRILKIILLTKSVGAVMEIAFNHPWPVYSLAIEKYTTNQQNRHRNAKYITRSILKKCLGVNLSLSPAVNLQKNFPHTLFSILSTLGGIITWRICLTLPHHLIDC